MYPKVKVREQDQGDQYAIGDKERSSLQSVKAFQSLSVHDSYPPVKEYQDDSPPTIVRIPESYVPNVLMPLISESKGAEKNDKRADEDDRPNIRASSIPRPRAVLSSPDNDGVIGNKSRMKAGRPSALRNHNSVQNRHAQCKVIPSHVRTESPINTGRKSKEVSDCKSDLKGKKGSAIAVSSQKGSIKTRKPSSGLMLAFPVTLLCYWGMGWVKARTLTERYLSLPLHCRGCSDALNHLAAFFIAKIVLLY